MKAEFTKGEWTRNGLVITDKDGLLIADCRMHSDNNSLWYDNHSKPSSELTANVALLAAAPKMYYALRYALQILRKLSDEGHYPYFCLAENNGKGFRSIINALEDVDMQDYSHGLDDLPEYGKGE